ncbi:MAG: diguanylate cyclase, partial [FCB group bacterium]|nr:diguanylate cyclase [FCB group bacterium]
MPRASRPAWAIAMAGAIMPARKAPISTYLRYTVVAVAAVILFVFLFARGRSVVYSEHDQFQRQMRQLASVEAELNEAVFRAQQGEAGALDTVRTKARVGADLAKGLSKSMPGFVGDGDRQEMNAELATVAKTFEMKQRFADAATPDSPDALRQILQQPSRRALEELAEGYARSYDLAFQAAHVNRLYLYAFAAVLFAALVYALWNLRGARHALRSAHETVDERVRERTQELIDSNASLQEVVAQLMQAESSLRESQERYELAARGANDGLWDWNIVSGRVYYSTRWKEMLGLGTAEVSERIEEWLDRVHPEDLQTVKEALDDHLAGATAQFDRVFRMQHKDGAHRWVLTRGIAVRDEEGKARRMAGSQSDVTERKLAEDRIRHDARHDGLTGLANRHLFMDRLDHALKLRRRRQKDLFAVLFLDLDRFKVINDSLGHAAGDALLKESALRIASCLRASDTASRLGNNTVARLGGDEFAVLIENLPDVTAAVRVAERIQQKLCQAFRIEDKEVSTSASIGIALSGDHYKTSDELLRDADTAMYRAKQLGKARHAIFDQEMHTQAMARLTLEGELRRAVEAQEFELHYQPIVSLQTERIEGFEALLRWRHPERGLLMPPDYFGVLEEMGLSVAVGWWVIREACQKLREWQALAGNRALTMGVNFSGRQFNQSGMADALEGILSECNIEPGNLNIEIMESVILANPDAAGKVLARLRDAGVGRSMDDF